MTDPDVKALAKRIFELEGRIAALGRARQLTASSLPVTVEGESGPETVEMPLTVGVSQGVRANVVVDDALATAEDAAADALAAKTSADGKNRIFAQQIEPVAHPDIPFVAGDLWYETDSSGRFVNVHVWNESSSAFVQHRIVASSVLVPGSVGPVLIEDGGVTGEKLAFTAIDGKTITGATMRTAASGQRMQFDAFGLSAYDLAGVQTSSLSSNNGAFTLTGGLTCTAGSVESTAYGPNTIYSYGGSPSAKITHFYASREGGLSWVPPAASGVGTSSIRPADDVTPDMQIMSPRGLRLRAGTDPGDDVSVLGSGLFRVYMARAQLDGDTTFVGESQFFDTATFLGDVAFASDTEWSGSPSIGSGVITVVRRGQTVEITWDVTASLASTTAHIAIGTIPLEMSPPARRVGQAWLKQGSFYSPAAVLPTGGLYVTNQTGAARDGAEGSIIYLLPSS